MLYGQLMSRYFSIVFLEISNVSSHQLHSRNTGLFLFLETILRKRNCFLSFIVADSKDGNGLKLEKKWANFFFFFQVLMQFTSISMLTCADCAPLKLSRTILRICSLIACQYCIHLLPLQSTSEASRQVSLYFF